MDIDRIAHRVVQRYLQAKLTLYWKARTSDPLPVGFKVPAAEPLYSKDRGVHRARRRTEQLFEDVRKRYYASKPSREGAKYVCPYPDGFCDPQGSFHRGGYVYEVDVSGKMHLADGNVFSEAAFAGMREDWNKVEMLAHDYWRGRMMSGDSMPEVIVQGTVTVTRQYYPYDW